MASLFSLSGTRKILDRIVGVLFYHEEERARRVGVAIREQGRGLQEQIRALADAAAVEEKLAKLAVSKVNKMKKLGMTDDQIKAMAEADFARLVKFAWSIEHIERLIAKGRLTVAPPGELP